MYVLFSLLEHGQWIAYDRVRGLHKLSPLFLIIIFDLLIDKNSVIKCSKDFGSVIIVLLGLLARMFAIPAAHSTPSVFLKVNYRNMRWNKINTTIQKYWYSNFVILIAYAFFSFLCAYPTATFRYEENFVKNLR